MFRVNAGFFLIIDTEFFVKVHRLGLLAAYHDVDRKKAANRKS